MSFGKATRLNIWFGHVDLWHHHQTIVWVIRFLHWLWRMVFICVFSLNVHQLTPGATVRWATCPPPECYQLHERPLLQLHSFKQKYSPFYEQVLWRNRGAKLYNSYLFKMRLWEIKPISQKAFIITGDTNKGRITDLRS